MFAPAESLADIYCLHA